MLAYRFNQLWQGCEQGDLVGPAGVHAPEERFDQAVAYLRTEPFGNDGADADVLGQVEPR